MKDKIAQDLMLPIDIYPKISLYATIREAIAFMQFTEIISNERRSMPRSLLVYDNNNDIVGMVRRRDILKSFEPDLATKSEELESKMYFPIQFDADLLELSYQSFIRDIILKANKTVGEIMIPITHKVSWNDHIIKIIYELNHYQHTLIPVVKDDKVIGVLRTIEIMDEIANLLNIKRI